MRYRGIAHAGGVIPGPVRRPCTTLPACRRERRPGWSDVLFASYSSIDRDRIAAVLGDLEALGHEVWLDEQLSGGQLWWDEILGHIRTCDAFLFLVSPASVASEACLAEFGYAQDLGRTVIPIELESMNPALLPSALGQHQLVSYSEGSRAELMALSRALGRLADGRPLPDPLPAPPPLPGGYFSTLRDEIAATDALTLEQQLGVLHRLRARADDASSEEILTLLATFRRRDDLYAYGRRGGRRAARRGDGGGGVGGSGGAGAGARPCDEGGPTTCSAG